MIKFPVYKKEIKYRSELWGKYNNTEVNPDYYTTIDVKL